MNEKEKELIIDRLRNEIRESLDIKREVNDEYINELIIIN